MATKALKPKWSTRTMYMTAYDAENSFIELSYRKCCKDDVKVYLLIPKKEKKK